MNIWEFNLIKFKVISLLDLNIIRCIANETLVCTVAVNGLNNFEVGFLTALPNVGDRVDVGSYTVCGVVSISVTGGLEILVDCGHSIFASKWRYIIVQSSDTEDEQLCIADVCVKEGSQCGVTFIFIHSFSP